MEISFNQQILDWIDNKRGDMSRQAFVRQIIYQFANAASERVNNENNTIRTKRPIPENT